jgi:hypothetical protein
MNTETILLVICYLEFLVTSTLQLIPLCCPLPAGRCLLSTGLQPSPKPPQAQCHQKHGQGPSKQSGPQGNHAR